MAKEELPEYAYLLSVRVKGFRTLKDSEVTFVPGLNIIIGENGVGKSNLLNISIRCCSFEYQELAFEIFDATYFNPKTLETNILSLKIRSEFIEEILSRKNVYVPSRHDTNEKYDLKIKSIDSNQDFPESIPHLSHVCFNIPEQIFFLDPPSNIEFELSLNSKDYLNKYVFENPFDSALLRNRLYSIVSFQEDSVPTVGEILTAYNISDEVKNYLIKYSPIEDIRLNDTINTHLNRGVFRISNLYLEFKVNNEWLIWPMLSAGTKRLFYLIFTVASSQSIVLIEEPELGVHPHQFHSIMLFLREQAQYKQIILTTHSPYALNVLGKDDLDSIIIAKLDKDKGSVFKHLSEEQKAKAIRYMINDDYLSAYWMHSDLEDDEEDED